MKFLKLTIHNIASIEDAEIDFEHGPLANDSRFLICGPTGAGKTTILDCICLALYGTTPRLNLKKVETYVDQYENFRLRDREDVKIDDTRMLMRRGSLDAFVEIIFTDKDDYLLKSVWQCNRVHNKLDGNVKEPDWLLYDAVTDTLLEDRKSNVLKEISNRIGLTFEQFCRTTMLAQGEFTKFLKSDEGDKSQILEKLTGTDIYSDISIRIHQIKSEKDALLTKISSMMKGVTLMSEDEVMKINQHISELQNKLEILSKEAFAINAKCLWKRKQDEYIKELQEVSDSLKEQNTKETTDEFRHCVSVLTDWDKTQEQRELWKNRSIAHQKIIALNLELKKMEDTYLRLYSRFNGLKLKLNEKINIQEKIKKYIAQESPKEECFKHVSLIEMIVTQINQKKAQERNSREIINSNNKEIKALESQLLQEQINVNKIHDSQREKTMQVNVASEHIAKLNYEKLLSKQKQTETKRLDLKDYQQLIQNHIRLTEDHLKKSQVCNEIQSSLRCITSNIQHLEKTVQGIDTAIKQQSDIYEKQERACSDVMKEYRSLLHDGDVCPLCGQKIFHLDNDKHFESILRPLKNALNNLQNESKDMHIKLSDSKAQFTMYINELPQKQHDLDFVTVQLKETLDKLASSPLHKIYGHNESSLIQIDSDLSLVTRESSEINAKLKEIGKQQQILLHLQKEKEQLDLVLHNTEIKVQEIVKHQTVLKEKNLFEQHVLTKVQCELDECRLRLSNFIDINLYEQQGQTFVDELKVSAQRYNIANEKAISVESNIQLIKNEINLIEQIKEKILDQQNEWRKLDTKQIICDIHNLSDSWIDLQTNISRISEAVSICQQQIITADSLLTKYFNAKDTVGEDRLSYLASIPLQEIDALRDKYQQQRDIRLKLTALKESCEKNLNLHYQSNPGINENVSLETLTQLLDVKTNDIKEQNQLLGKYTQTLDGNQQNRIRYDAIGKELEVARKECEEWNHLHKLFGSNDGKKFRNIAQSYVLEQLLINANQYLSQFSPRYEMECQPGSLTILLRDKEAGGVIRPTTTISGGESFLISLSLALGLSSLSRTTLSMDTIFIDEGFGTLDSSYLSCVIDTLERLHQIGGKRIGIISHVESLKERINTQIQVSKINNTLSKIHIVSLV